MDVHIPPFSDLQTAPLMIGNFQPTAVSHFGGMQFEVAEPGPKLFATEVLPVLNAWRTQDTAGVAERRNTPGH